MPIRDQLPPHATPAPKVDWKGIFSSPLARRIAREKGLELSSISGSGPRGRVIKRDVEASLEKGMAKKAGEQIKPVPALASPNAMPADPVLELFDEGSYELVKHDGVRLITARRLVAAKQTIPHFHVSIDCELDALLKLCSQMNCAAPIRDHEPACRISVDDLVVKAWALALRDVPDANVSWTKENMLRHKHVDIGVAVSVSGGPTMPIIRAADTKSVSAISNQMRDFEQRARERKLKPEEFEGGTSAVSNMGKMGIKHFSTVVGPPHATILAIGAGERRPVVKEGALQVATVMTVTLSADHRCVDGALGSKVLVAFKSYIECPILLFV